MRSLQLHQLQNLGELKPMMKPLSAQASFYLDTLGRIQCLKESRNEFDFGLGGVSLIDILWWRPNSPEQIEKGQIKITRHAEGGIKSLRLKNVNTFNVLGHSDSISGPWNSGVLWATDLSKNRPITLLGVKEESQGLMFKWLIHGKHISDFETPMDIKCFYAMSDVLCLWSHHPKVGGGIRAVGGEYALSLSGNNFFDETFDADTLKIEGFFQPKIFESKTQLLVKNRGYIHIEREGLNCLSAVFEESDCFEGFIALCQGQNFRFEGWQLDTGESQVHLIAAQEHSGIIPNLNWLLISLEDRKALTEAYRGYRQWFMSSKPDTYLVKNSLTTPTRLTDADLLFRMSLTEGLARKTKGYNKKGSGLSLRKIFEMCLTEVPEFEAAISSSLLNLGNQADRQKTETTSKLAKNLADHRNILAHSSYSKDIGSVPRKSRWVRNFFVMHYLVMLLALNAAAFPSSAKQRLSEVVKQLNLRVDVIE